MAMADARDEYQRQLLQTVHSLSDLELAALLCLIAREHCLISTVPDSVDELADELRLVATKTFNLRPVIVNCHPHTTLDDFATALLIPSPHSSSPVTGQNSNNDPRSVSPFRARQNEALQQQQPAGSYFFLSSRTAAPNAGLRGGGGGGSGNIAISSTGQSYSTTSQQQQSHHQPQIANIILAKHLDRAPKAVQIQALELLRTRRIFTRTSVQPAPKQFLFIALVGAAGGSQARVTKHLNDFFYISHWHDPEESGFPHLDGEYGDQDADSSDPEIYSNDEKASIDSGSSVVKKTPLLPSSDAGFSPSLSSSSLRKPKDTSTTTPTTEKIITPVLKESDISHLAQQTLKVRISIDVLRYQMNIIAFLRMHRAVMGPGCLTPFATRHFDQLVKSLAPLHGLDYVTPSLVALAVKKIYLHRIDLVSDPQKERSAQWGSELAAVEVLLDEVDVEGVIEDVLAMVGVPS
ncbi:hypothetical protein QBC37DRAFT_410733 [Rhypophila decipiens]|uniref:Magnesium chelatase n=1 Tax=Rhypophila decipiens TaxID=261697 RepID=A0AAN7BD03_9PEZI|nr:hypothetical protein QBC37DRAFT_410733 [Rhypophila decipiens]